MVCGFSLRIRASSRIVNSTISRPNEILVAFIRSDPSWQVLHRPSPVIQSAVSIADLIDVAQGRYQRHWQTAHSLKSLRWENFRWTGLGQQT
jgi:hypothetical protein